MKLYRYNSKNRNDRKFNCTGTEKNPNAIKYYATNLDYAENYRYVYFENGDINYECELEAIEIKDLNLFDMNNNYSMLKSYKTYINDQINGMRPVYESILSSMKKKKDIKMWSKKVDDLNNGNTELELIKGLVYHEFQLLSDFKYQNILVSELKEMGFDGYITKNEVAIF